VATALEHGFDSIVSSDRNFDEVPGLRRIAPSEV
jgi:predicted nucleic acid-binding protein